MRENPDIYTGERLLDAYGDGATEKQAAKDVVEAGLPGPTSAEREAALYLLKALFPRLNAVYGNMHYGRQ